MDYLVPDCVTQRIAHLAIVTATAPLGSVSGCEWSMSGSVRS